VTSIITTLIAVLGGLAAAALPSVLQGLRAGRLRKEIVELADVRTKLAADNPQQQAITELIRARTTRLIELMGAVRLRRWLIVASLGMALTIATLVSVSGYMQHRANKALADFSNQNAKLQQLMLKGLTAVLAQPPDDKTAAAAETQLDPLMNSTFHSLHVYNSDADWARGLLDAGLVLAIFTAATLALVIGRLALRLRRELKKMRPHSEGAR